MLWSAAGRQLSEVHQHIEALERQASGSEAAAAAEGELATLYKLDEALAKLVALPHAPLVVYPILVQTAQARMPIPSLTSSTQEVHKLQVWAEHMLKCKYMSALVSSWWQRYRWGLGNCMPWRWEQRQSAGCAPFKLTCQVQLRAPKPPPTDPQPCLHLCLTLTG